MQDQDGQNNNLLEFLAEAFRCHVHHFQYLTVPVEDQDGQNNNSYLFSQNNCGRQDYLISCK